MSTRHRLAPHILTIIIGLGGITLSCGGDTTPVERKVGGTRKTATGGRSAKTTTGTVSSQGGQVEVQGGSSSTDGGNAIGSAGSASVPDLQSGGGLGQAGSPENLGGNIAVGVAGAGNASGPSAAAGALSVITGVPTATVTLTPATTYQTLEGFGAAVAWYQGSLTGHKKSAEIYQLIFGDLGLDVLRLRNTFGRSEFSNAARDKTILDAATASLGRRPKVLMTSWSPPANLKANNLEKCSGEATCTLKKINDQFPYAEFANYWFDAIAAYRAIGISPDWVSIQNETDYIPSGWEGCKFTPSETTTYPGYANALSAVSAKFNTMTEIPKLIGPETLGIHWNKMQSYMPVLDKSLLWAAAHHLYEMGNDSVWDWRSPGPDSFITVMKGAKATVGTLPILQTEFQTDDDKNIEGGFETAWLIHNSLVEEGVSGWLYWDLVWGASRGLVSLPDTTNYSIRDQYYSLRHYARYTDPGYVRVGAASSLANVRVSAFHSPDQRRITLVLLNVGTAEERVSLALGGFAAKTSEVYRTVYVPGSSVRWATQPAVDQGGLLILPSRSVATVVLDG